MSFIPFDSNFEVQTVYDKTGFFEIFEECAESGDCTALCEALKSNPSLLEDMLRKNISLNSSKDLSYELISRFGNMMTESVIKKDNSELLDILLNAGLSPDSMVISNLQFMPIANSMVFTAVAERAERCLEVLINHGANLNVFNPHTDVGFLNSSTVYSTPLNYAVSNGDESMFEALMNGGAEPYPDTIYAMYAVTRCRSRQIFEAIAQSAAWNIGGMNWFDAMIKHCGAEKYSSGYSSGMSFALNQIQNIDCVLPLYSNLELLKFLVDNGSITAEFISRTIKKSEVSISVQGVIEGLNLLADADLLDDLTPEAALYLGNEISSRSVFGIPVAMSDKLSKIVERSAGDEQPLFDF